MPFSPHAATMKIFSSVSGNPAAASLARAGATPLLGLASSISSGLSVATGRPMRSEASFTISGSGGTGVLPKWPSTILP